MQLLLRRAHHATLSNISKCAMPRPLLVAFIACNPKLQYYLCVRPVTQRQAPAPSFFQLSCSLRQRQVPQYRGCHANCVQTSSSAISLPSAHHVTPPSSAYHHCCAQCTALTNLFTCCVHCKQRQALCSSCPLRTTPSSLTIAPFACNPKLFACRVLCARHQALCLSCPLCGTPSSLLVMPFAHNAKLLLIVTSPRDFFGNVQ